MLSPAVNDLLCRKKAGPPDSILYLAPSSSLRRIPCHQAPRSMEFLVICSSLAVCIASCRHPIQWLLFGFEETTICHKNVRRTKPLGLLLENDVEVLRSTKTLQPWIPLQRSKQTLHEAKRAALPETGRRVDGLYSRRNQTPQFALLLFLRSSFNMEGQAS